MVNLTKALDSISRALDKSAQAYQAEENGFVPVLMDLLLLQGDIMFQFQRALILGISVFIIVMSAQICCPAREEIKDDDVISVERLRELMIAVNAHPRDDAAVVRCLDALGVDSWDKNRQDTLTGAKILREYAQSQGKDPPCANFALVLNLALCQLLVPPVPEPIAALDDSGMRYLARGAHFAAVCHSSAAHKGALLKVDGKFVLAKVCADHVSRTIVVIWSTRLTSKEAYGDAMGLAHLVMSPSVPLGNGEANKNLLDDVSVVLESIAPRAFEACDEFNYSLVQVGHGLGASAAQLSSFLLAGHAPPSLTEAELFAFGPVPVMSRFVQTSVEQKSPHVFVHTRDYLPRLTQANLEKTLALVNIFDSLGPGFPLVKRLSCIVQARLPFEIVKTIDDELKFLTASKHGGGGEDDFVISSEDILYFQGANRTVAQGEDAAAWVTCSGLFFTEDFVFVGGRQATQSNSPAKYLASLHSVA